MTKRLVFLFCFLSWAAGLAAQTTTSYEVARALRRGHVAALRTAKSHYLPWVSNAAELARDEAEVARQASPSRSTYFTMASIC
jgi:hypothetical protein